MGELSSDSAHRQLRTVGGENQYLREGCLASTGLAANKDGSASNLAVSDHAENNTSCASSIDLNKIKMVRRSVARDVAQWRLDVF